MYIVGQELTVNFRIIGVTAPSLSDYDILVQRPDGTKTSHLSALYLNTETAGTANDFVLSYVLTPDVPGVWAVKLTGGTGAAYKVFKTINLAMHYPDTTAYQQVSIRELDSTLSDDLAGTSLE